MGTEAVAGQKHLFFKPDGGIASQLRFAQTRYDVLAAIAPGALKPRPRGQSSWRRMSRSSR